MAKSSFQRRLYGCKLQTLDPTHKWTPPNPRRYNVLEINITQRDLLPLSSLSLLDIYRLLKTIYPFQKLERVILVMGINRVTDVEELCLEQELDDWQVTLDEFWVAAFGLYRRAPRLYVRWLFEVEELGWPDI